MRCRFRRFLPPRLFLSHTGLTSRYSVDHPPHHAVERSRRRVVGVRDAVAPADDDGRDDHHRDQGDTDDVDHERRLADGPEGHVEQVNRTEADEHGAQDEEVPEASDELVLPGPATAATRANQEADRERNDENSDGDERPAEDEDHG
jgi:hypothetical protein